MKYFVMFAIVVLLLVPFHATNAGLVVCGSSTNDSATDYDETRACTPCLLLEQVKTILDFIILTFTPIVAIFMFLLSGVFMILGGASPEMISKGRSMLTLTVVGVVIIYGSYLVANTIIQVLAGDNDTAASWFELKCTGGGAATTSGGSGGGGGVSDGGGGRTWNPPPVVTGSLSDADARKYLESRSDGKVTTDGLTICTQENFQNECGSFEGVKQTTLDEILRLQNDCGCTIGVNDATGPGHEGAAHPAGTAFDLQRSPTIDARIRQYPLAPGYSDGKHFVAPGGAIYWQEDSVHWHVEV